MTQQTKLILQAAKGWKTWGGGTLRKGSQKIEELTFDWFDWRGN